MNSKSIALCRVSTLEQKIEGHSLERQELSVIKASEQLSAEIIKTWSLDQSSRSGKNLKRKDLLEMIEFCKQNKQVKFLIVDEVDRFMRSIDEFYYFEVSFRELGVKVWYASQPELNTDDWAAKVTKVLAILRAEMSNIERQGKSLNGLKARVALGYWPFPVHQGYTKSSEPGLHIPDPIRFSLLQEAFRDVISRRRTVNEALRSLKSKGYKTPNNKELKIDKFRDLLKDPYYAGALRVDKWDEKLWNNSGLHQAMITMTEWEELQLTVNDKMRKFQRKKHNPKYPLDNIIFHSGCVDEKLVGFDHRNGKSNWLGEEYKCRGCKKIIKREKAHLMVNEFLESINLSEENRGDFERALRKVWAQEKQDSFQRIKQLKIRLQSFLDEKNRLATGIVMHPEIADDLTVSLRQKKSEINALEIEIAELENIEDDFVEFVRFSFDYINNLKEEWWDLDFDDRLECKQLLTKDKIIIDYSQKVYTPQLSPILKLIGKEKEAQSASKSYMVEVAGVTPASKKLKTHRLQA